MHRLREYRIFYRKDRYEWQGPRLRSILKLVCPMQKLLMSADDMFWMNKTEIAAQMCCVSFSCSSLNHNTSAQQAFMKQPMHLRKVYVAKQTNSTCSCPLLRLSSRPTMRKSSNIGWFGMLGFEFRNMLLFVMQCCSIGFSTMV